MKYKELLGTVRPAVLQFCNTIESDRGIALNVGATLDGELGDFINENMSIKKDMPFAAKIKFVYENGLIPDNIFDDLNLIKDIRNWFAHEEGIVTLEDREVRVLCAKFKNVYFYENSSARMKFCSVANYILALISFSRAQSKNLEHKAVIENAQEGIKMLVASRKNKN